MYVHSFICGELKLKLDLKIANKFITFLSNSYLHGYQISILFGILEYLTFTYSQTPNKRVHTGLSECNVELLVLTRANFPTLQPN